MPKDMTTRYSCQHRRGLVSRFAVLTALTAPIALGAGPALAQGTTTATTPAQQGRIPTIKVTAEFRSENVQNTPIAITAVNAAMLQARGQTNIVQAATQAPNVTLTRNEGAFGNALTASIRGIGQYDSDPAFEPGVGLYVDDVYYSQLTGSVLDLLDVSRVEVLRGPQGTLEGMNSIGGSIRIFSKPPNGDNSATLQATYGAYNRMEIHGSGDFSLVPDKLFVRVSGIGKSQDGYVTRKDFGCAVPTLSHYVSIAPNAGPPLSVTQTVHNTPSANPIAPMPGSNASCTLGHEGGTDYAAGRVMLRWLATDKIEDNFIADYTSDNSQGPATTLLALGDSEAFPAGASWTPRSGMSSLGPAGPSAFSPAKQLNISNSGIPANSDLVPQLIPSDPYVSYASFYMPGGLKYPGNGGPMIDTAPLIAKDQSHLRSWGMSNTLDWKLFDNFSIKSITAYRRYSSAWSEDNDVSPLPNSLGIEKMTHWQLSQEVRFSGDAFDKAVEYTFGSFYFDQNTTYATHQDLLYTSALFNFFGDDPVDATTVAGFLHAVWHVTDKLNLEGGVRYTDDEKTYTFHRHNADTFGGNVAFNSLPTVPAIPFNPAAGQFGSCAVSPSNPLLPGLPFAAPPNQDCLPNYNWPVAGLNGVSSKSTTTRADWRAAVDYHWTPNLMTYFQFSTGFKGGGVNPRPFNPHQVLPFGPEKLKSYEVGAKSTWLGTLRLNGAAFYEQYQNIQTTINNCSAQAGAAFGIPCALPIAGGDATIWGLELESEFHPTDQLSIDASGSYIHFKYDTIVPAALASGILPGNVTPYTPTWKWNLGAQYRFDLGNYGSLTPRFDVDYRSSFFSNATNTPGSKVSGRTLTNAHLTWESPDQSLDVILEVTNLTNDLYYVNKFDLLAVSGFIAGQPGAPREWAFTVRKKF